MKPTELSVPRATGATAAGRAAFGLWRSVYISKQVSPRNRLLVIGDWVRTRVFGRDITRF